MQFYDSREPVHYACKEKLEADSKTKEVGF